MASTKCGFESIALRKWRSASSSLCAFIISRARLKCAGARRGARASAASKASRARALSPSARCTSPRVVVDRRIVRVEPGGMVEEGQGALGLRRLPEHATHQQQRRHLVGAAPEVGLAQRERAVEIAPAQVHARFIEAVPLPADPAPAHPAAQSGTASNVMTTCACASSGARREWNRYEGKRTRRPGSSVTVRCSNCTPPRWRAGGTPNTASRPAPGLRAEPMQYRPLTQPRSRISDSVRPPPDRRRASPSM